jgi:hypothetical protein
VDHAPAPAEWGEAHDTALNGIISNRNTRVMGTGLLTAMSCLRLADGGVPEQVLRVGPGAAERGGARLHGGERHDRPADQSRRRAASISVVKDTLVKDVVRERGCHPILEGG